MVKLVVSFRLDPELIEALEEFSRRFGMSKSELVRIILYMFLCENKTHWVVRYKQDMELEKEIRREERVLQLVP